MFVWGNADSNIYDQNISEYSRLFKAHQLIHIVFCILIQGAGTLLNCHFFKFRPSDYWCVQHGWCSQRIHSPSTVTTSVATTPLQRRGMRNRNEARQQRSFTGTDGHVHQCAISEPRHGEGKNKRAGAWRKKKEKKKHIHIAAAGRYHTDYLAVCLFLHFILSSDYHLSWFQHIWFLLNGRLNSGLCVCVCVCIAEKIRCKCQICFSRRCPVLDADTLNVKNVNMLNILFITVHACVCLCCMVCWTMLMLLYTVHDMYLQCVHIWSLVLALWTT